MASELDRYARDYRIESMESAEDAVARLGELQQGTMPVAMVLADLALLPSAGGVELLTRVRGLVPTARNALLLEWGLRPEQIRPVARAVELGVVNVVLTKPTGARDEEFHGAITEELGEWGWTTAPVVEAVRVVADEDARERGMQICDLLD